MPKLGDTINASKLGYKTHSLLIWGSCENCHKERWVRRSDLKKGKRILCLSCAHSGPNSSVWTGGRLVNIKGYVHVWIPKSSPFYPMTKGRRGRVLEHRLVMAQHLGRCLDQTEVVHHINSIRHDNRLENLELVSSKGQHNTHENDKINDLIREVKKLSRIINKQSQEIKALRQLKLSSEYKRHHDIKTRREQ